MPTTQTTARLPRSFDEHGRAIPLTPEEVRLRAASAIQALDDVEAIGDEQEQARSFEALKQAIDEEPLAARRRFR